MNMRVNTRLIVVLVLVLAIFMSFSVGIAQDEGGDTSTEPAGVGEIAKTADNFNVPAVLTPQDEDMAVSTLARRLFTSPTDPMDPQIQMRFQSEKRNLSLLRTVNQNIERVKSLMDGGGSIPKRMRLGQTPSGDLLAQVADDSSGDVLTVFTDYSVIAAHAKWAAFFQGHIAGQSAASLMIFGKNTDGNQYALSHGYVPSLRPDLESPDVDRSAKQIPPGQTPSGMFSCR
jgi:hypothetical protein